MQAFFFLSFRRHCFGLLSHWNVCFFIDPKKPQTLTFALWACYPVFLCKFNPACLCRQAHEWFPLLSVIIRTHTCWSDFKLPVSSLASGHSHRSLKQSCFLLLAWFFFCVFLFFFKFYSQWCSPVCCWSFRVGLWAFGSQSQAAIFEQTALFDNLNLF